MIDKIVIGLCVVFSILLVVTIILLFKDYKATEKKRKAFESTLKVGDKCRVSLHGVYIATISKIEGDIATIKIKRYKGGLYPPEQK